MATSPRTNKQQRRDEIEKANPLGGVDLGDNLGATFSTDPDENAAGPAAFTQAQLDAAVAQAVYAALNAPKYTEAGMQEMLARARAEALVTQAEKSVAPLTPQQEAAVAHISSSGRAPTVSDAERVWIILDDNDEIPPGGQYVGVNGVGYQLLPGMEVFVPKAVCEVLDHAIKSIPVTDPMTRRIIGWKNRKRFPYTIVNKAAAHAAEEA